jgi:hypothetical protein
MYFAGTSVVWDIISSSFLTEETQRKEISNVINQIECPEHKQIEDIVRLPLKLGFPSLPVRQPSGNYKPTTIAGPDGNVSCL